MKMLFKSGEFAKRIEILKNFIQNGHIIIRVVVMCLFFVVVHILVLSLNK